MKNSVDGCFRSPRFLRQLERKLAGFEKIN